MLQSQLAAVQSSAGDARVLIEADPDSSGGLRYLIVTRLANPVPLGSGTFPWFRIVVTSGSVANPVPLDTTLLLQVRKFFSFLSRSYSSYTFFLITKKLNNNFNGT